ncbi:MULTISPECIES: hypothetical protein [unclassified Chryseobacterium]|uniref:hypothetical protein n=1 Tax=unclassified Chryseobacterium TaxID=2593645 RepID=UPI000FB07A36|nr:hypothetical protein [Chryseobacterium sp. BIGb0232]MCS4302308.1 hypothetical protein [Chryseobacterium sp. BIGb0232]ROS18253.1 hypothetical protein EDF65_2645 [Chryseobacterium nakagawai]
MKKIYSSSALLLMILVSVCCKKTVDNLSKNAGHNKNYFSGDSILASPNYFNSLKNKKGDMVLQQQNEEYLKKYTLSENNESYFPLKDNVSIKLVKEKQIDRSIIKVNLFTYVNNKKTDSIQFYRNISGEGFGNYNCLSYFNAKTNKIWQIKYFPLNPLRGNSAGIVSYTESSISPDGTIKSDSLHYLDESLDVEMEKYNLYY